MQSQFFFNPQKMKKLCCNVNIAVKLECKFQHNLEFQKNEKISTK